MATPEEILRAALGGGQIPRPLVAPLASAAAASIEALEPQTFLHDVTKLTKLVRELATSLRADVAVAEFGTFWDAEILGARLDWSAGLPAARPGQRLADAPDFTRDGRGSVVLEGVARLRKVLWDKALVAAGVTGPVKLSGLFAGMTPPEAARVVLEPVRRLCESGAQIIFVVDEAARPADYSALTAALRPVWGTVRFYQGLGVLHLAGEADQCVDIMRPGGSYLACFDPEASPSLAAWARGSGGRYGLAVRPGHTPDADLRRTGRCVLITNDGELAARVKPSDLQRTVAQMRGLT